MVNADAFPDDFSQLCYLWTRVGGLAARSLEAIDPKSTQEATQCLRRIFEDPDKVQHCRETYRKLYQGSKPFNEFLNEFLNLAMEGQIPESMWASDLTAKLRFTLQAKLEINGARTYDEVVAFCRRVDERDLAERLRVSNARNQNQNPKNEQEGASGDAAKSEQAPRPPNRYQPGGPRLCYGCQRPGHTVAFCPTRNAGNTAPDQSKNA